MEQYARQAAAQIASATETRELALADTVFGKFEVQVVEADSVENSEVGNEDVVMVAEVAELYLLEQGVEVVASSR